eukprot:gene5360-7434_t
MSSCFVAPLSKQELLQKRLFEAKDEDYVNCFGGGIIKRMTLGIKENFSRFAATKKFSSFSYLSSSLDPKHRYNDMYGNLRTESALPQINGRYHLIKKINGGSFSDLMVGEDVFANISESQNNDSIGDKNFRKIAVKIMKHGYNILGEREKIILLHLSNASVRSNHNFALLLDSFYFQNHVCLVMKLYQTTLLLFINNQQSDEKSPNGNKGEKSGSNKPLLIKPKPTHKQPYDIHSNHINILTTHHTNSILFLNENQTRISSSSSCVNMKALKRIALQLISALCVLEEEGIIHADIKPENCFITSDFLSAKYNNNNNSNNNIENNHENNLNVTVIEDLPDDIEVKLGDFGNSFHISEFNRYINDGGFNLQSLPYRAPEILLGLSDNNITSTMDMWSLGVLLIELFTRKPLFIVHSRIELIEAIYYKIAPFDPVKFGKGVYGSLLIEFMKDLTINQTKVHNNDNNNNQIKSILKLLDNNNIQNDNKIDYDFVSFLSLLLCVDPDYRIKPLEAMKHPFISSLINVPLQLLKSYDYNNIDNNGNNNNNNNNSNNNNNNNNNFSKINDDFSKQDLINNQIIIIKDEMSILKNKLLELEHQKMSLESVVNNENYDKNDYDVINNQDTSQFIPSQLHDEKHITYNNNNNNNNNNNDNNNNDNDNNNNNNNNKTIIYDKIESKQTTDLSYDSTVNLSANVVPYDINDINNKKRSFEQQIIHENQNKQFQNSIKSRKLSRFECFDSLMGITSNSGLNCVTWNK